MSDPNLMEEIKEIKRDVAEINNKIDEMLIILHSLIIVEDNDMEDDEDNEEDYSNEGWISDDVEWFDNNEDGED